jgi:phosphonate transport system permease protein
MGENLPMKTLCLKIVNLFKKIQDLNLKRRTSKMNDGTPVVKPVSYKLIYGILTLIVFLYFWNMIVINFFNSFGINRFLRNLPNFFSIIEKMLANVNWQYFDKIIDPMLATIQISIAGTLIGALLAFPVAFLASQNIMGKSIIPGITKFVIAIIRTFPTLVYALILSFIFGFGTFIGALATIIFTFSIMTKMMYEIIETVDMGPFIAIETTGASKLLAFRTAILPQIAGRFYSITLYNFEINIRSSSILGFVGAGGIGMILNDQMALLKYGNVSVILLSLLTVIIILENLSRYLRKRLA